MEEEKSKFENLSDDFKDYLNMRVDLVKLKLVDKGGTVISSVLSNLALIIIFIFILIFLSFGVAYGISEAIGKTYSGFLIVAVFYLLCGFTLYIMREKWIKIPIINMLIKQFLGKEHNNE